MFPFGRRAFRRELLPLLEAAAALRPRPWRLASVRDILVQKPAREAYAWMRDAALAHYDRILVHTDPALIPFGLTFPFAAAWRTGWSTPAMWWPDGRATPELGPPEVLVSAGGGRVGAALLEAAIEASGYQPRPAPWRLVAGGALRRSLRGAACPPARRHGAGSPPA